MAVPPPPRGRRSNRLRAFGQCARRRHTAALTPRSCLVGLSSVRAGRGSLQLEGDRKTYRAMRSWTGGRRRRRRPGRGRTPLLFGRLHLVEVGARRRCRCSAATRRSTHDKSGLPGLAPPRTQRKDTDVTGPACSRRSKVRDDAASAQCRDKRTALSSPGRRRRVSRDVPARGAAGARADTSYATTRGEQWQRSEQGVNAAARGQQDSRTAGGGGSGETATRRGEGGRRAA